MSSLTAARVKSECRTGRHPDGDGLNLVIWPSGSNSWVSRVQKDDGRSDFGPGGTGKVSLAKTMA